MSKIKNEGIDKLGNKNNKATEKIKAILYILFLIHKKPIFLKVLRDFRSF